MNTYILTFGKGKEKVVLTETGADLLIVLSKLREAGWEIENITEIKINPINI